MRVRVRVCEHADVLRPPAMALSVSVGVSAGVVRNGRRKA